MQPNVMTRYHVKVIWITFAAIGVITLLLYGYGRLVPTANPENSQQCVQGPKIAFLNCRKIRQKPVLVHLRLMMLVNLQRLNALSRTSCHTIEVLFNATVKFSH